MVDRGLVGGGWVTVENFSRRVGACKSTCQLEIDVAYEQVKPVDMIKIAPLRILSFDIECYNPAGKGFPRAESSPVIDIAAYVKEQGSDEKLVQAIWTLNTCSPIA